MSITDALAAAAAAPDDPSAIFEAASQPADLPALIALARRAHDAHLLALSRDTGSREHLWVWPVGG